MPPAQPTARLRLTVWASPHLLSDKSLAGGKGICDEIAFLSTILNNDDLKAHSPSGDLDWKAKPLDIELSDTVNEGMLGQAIHACHKARMQAVAGYRLVDAKFQAPRRFNAWLRSLLDGDLAANRSQEIVRFAMKISDFLDRDFGTGDLFDGISFDIETVGWHRRPGEAPLPNPDDPTKAQAIGEVLAEFYRTLADLLRTKPFVDPARNHVASQLVAVAPGGLVDATHSHHNPLGGLQPAGFSFIAHDYAMAKNRVNFIVRPMGYDNFTVLDKQNKPIDNTAIMDRWHKEIIDYALSEGAHKTTGTGAGLGPFEFQLGIKISPGPSNDPKDPSFQNLDGVMQNHPGVVQRCGELRTRGVGLCVFAFTDVAKLKPNETVESKSASFWASMRDCDAKLNPPAAPGKPLRGDVETQPFQNPHDAVSVKRLL
jgi:hypothetical protein